MFWPSEGKRQKDNTMRRRHGRIKQGVIVGVWGTSIRREGER